MENPDPKCRVTIPAGKAEPDDDCNKAHCPLCERTRPKADGTSHLVRRHVEPRDRICVHCLGAARRWLKAIPTYALEVATHLHHGYTPKSPGISERVSRDAEPPMIGGNRLVLLGPGNTPDSRNTLHVDNLDTDPPAVLAYLLDWEWDMRLRLDSRRTSSQTLADCCVWIGDRLTWASRDYSEYEPFHHELRRLHQHLEQAASRSNAPVKDPAECLDHPDEPVNLVRLWWPRIVNRKTSEVIRHGGLDDLWECPFCHRRYKAADYNMARRETIRRDEDRAAAVTAAQGRQEVG